MAKLYYLFNLIILFCEFDKPLSYGLLQIAY